MENGSQNGWSQVRAARPFSDLFRDLVFYVDFMLNLAHFGLPLATLWLTFGSRWFTFGSLLAPFGSLLVHFWCPLAYFWCPFLHFCSLRDQSSHFCCILSSFFVYFWINLSCQRQKFRSWPLKGGLRADLLSVGMRLIRFGKI